MRQRKPKPIPKKPSRQERGPADDQRATSSSGTEAPVPFERGRLIKQALDTAEDVPLLPPEKRGKSRKREINETAATRLADIGSELAKHKAERQWEFDDSDERIERLQQDVEDLKQRLAQEPDLTEIIRKDVVRATVFGSAGATVAAWVVGETLPKEMVKAAIQGAVGGVALLIITVGEQILQRVWLRYKPN
jgi:hypothetical protein